MAVSEALQDSEWHTSSWLGLKKAGERGEKNGSDEEIVSYHVNAYYPPTLLLIILGAQETLASKQ